MIDIILVAGNTLVYMTHFAKLFLYVLSFKIVLRCLYKSTIIMISTIGLRCLLCITRRELRVLRSNKSLSLRAISLLAFLPLLERLVRLIVIIVHLIRIKVLSLSVHHSVVILTTSTIIALRMSLSMSSTRRSILHLLLIS